MGARQLSEITDEEAHELGAYVKLLRDIKGGNFESSAAYRISVLQGKILGKAMTYSAFTELIRGNVEDKGSSLTDEQLGDAVEEAVACLGNCVAIGDDTIVIKDPIIQILPENGAVKIDELYNGITGTGKQQMDDVIDILLRTDMLYPQGDGLLALTEAGSDLADMRILFDTLKLPNAETAAGSDLEHITYLLSKGIITIDRNGKCIATQRASQLRKKVEETNAARLASGQTGIDFEMLVLKNKLAVNS
ncbi:MAG: hypothetical protein KGH60_01095 [Candidatus Micrarchaeota archaeon]|nr:hypothetical protein [Candidatus Micrarchaeota archaeon]